MPAAESGGPAWRVIADALRSDIADEVYPPGSPLPGEAPLAERYDVSRPTVRRAINVLVGEGLLTVAHGRGTFVRSRPERRVILINAPKTADLLAEDYDPSAQGWLRGEHAKAVELRRAGVDARDAVITSAGRHEAEALGVRTGTRVVYRYEYWRHRTLHQTIAVTSITPAHLVGLLPEPKPEEPADLYDWDPDDPEYPYNSSSSNQEEPDDLPDDYDPQDEPEGSTSPEWKMYDRLTERHGPVRFVSSVTARMPVGDEATDLAVATGTAVLEVRRTMADDQGRPLEVTTITAPADRFEVASAPEWLAATHHTGGDAAAVLRL
ncbi:GntR family transcriptional regulator [Streptomyces sp. TRM 70361]|uniref:GntR family transcriptional regulator n=1 Tax=Streptomyces sp. TRM 70361 TaxID=3116553 RepID=UPI002E7BB14F|nr:GntR family transcriptional regulator [Streptomyces sp. TRM 70361]MEE1939660.1 GntR family transcriptional regulator [Streptomyces sp. TRM 70361]